VFQITSLLLLFSCDQKRDHEFSNQKIEELKATIQHQFQAMLEGDLEILERIFSEDYVMTTRKGAQLTTADWIQMLASGRHKYLNIRERADVSINIYGNVAVVRGLIGSTAYERNGERLETGPRRFMAIWLYEDKIWHQVARQHTAVVDELN
jgi:hypothetical protein